MTCCPFQFCGDRFVGAQGRAGTVPSPSIRVCARIGGFGEGSVDFPPFGMGGRLVDDGPYQGVPEADPLS